MISAALMCMALNIYHESRSEEMRGQVAVANVTLNRVASNKWPNDVCSVVKQGYTKGKQTVSFHGSAMVNLTHQQTRWLGLGLCWSPMTL